MVGRKLRETLKQESLDIAELAREVIAVSRGATLKELQDAFRVALGTGCLNEQRAKALFAALNQLSRSADMEPVDAEIVSLQHEIEQLERQEQNLSPEQKEIKFLSTREKELQDLSVELQEQLVNLHRERDRLELIKGDIKR